VTTLDHSQCESTWCYRRPSSSNDASAAKSLLLRTMTSQIWTLEEFSTVLCRVGAAARSWFFRPKRFGCLKPGDFLICRPLLAVPESDVPDSQKSIRTRWKLIQQLFRSFWRRWVQEYLNCTLQAREKWVESSDNLKVSTMVSFARKTDTCKGEYVRSLDTVMNQDKVV